MSTAPMEFWTQVMLRLGAVLLVIALFPLAVALTALPTLNPLIPLLALYALGPIALLCLFLGCAFWLWQRFNK